MIGTTNIDYDGSDEGKSGHKFITHDSWKSARDESPCLRVSNEREVCE